jgi:hypothetical protein
MQKNTKLGTKVNIDVGSLPGLCGYTSEGPWSLSFISFTVNLPLFTIYFFFMYRNFYSFIYCIFNNVLSNKAFITSNIKTIVVY